MARDALLIVTPFLPLEIHCNSYRLNYGQTWQPKVHSLFSPLWRGRNLLLPVMLLLMITARCHSYRLSGNKLGFEEFTIMDLLFSPPMHEASVAPCDVAILILSKTCCPRMCFPQYQSSASFEESESIHITSLIFIFSC